MTTTQRSVGADENFGESLRWWRTERRFSQLQLAADSEVSTRHISFLETGKAKPSREMVLHLAEALDVPLRDRNRLLHVAGFSPVYSETMLDAPAMDDVRSVLSTVLEAHMPNPALICDAKGDLVDANAASWLMLGETIDSASAALGQVLNLNRLALHPDGVRARSRDWETLASATIQRLEREVHHRPADQGLAALFDEMLTYPDVDSLRREPVVPTGTDLVIPLHLTTNSGDELRLITTIATVGAAYDVTLEELRIETFFPVDRASREVLARWADAAQ